MTDFPTHAAADHSPSRPVLTLLSPPGESESSTSEVDSPTATTANKQPPKYIVRIWSAFVASVTLPMLGVGLYLHPSPDGTGTHEQLGLPPCGFYKFTGIPCPTCGCTTSVSHFAHGHLIASFVTQPFGFAVALMATMAAFFAIIGLVTGRWHGPTPFWIGWYQRTLVAIAIGIFIFGWAFKIMNTP